MFNQLTPSDLVSAIGVTARAAARSHDPAGAFERDQLLSAYSATRHLAVELEHFGPVFAAFVADTLAALSASDLQTAASNEAVGRAVASLQADGSTAAVGAALCDVLAALAGDADVRAQALRTELHALLRALADREVDLVADALAA